MEISYTLRNKELERLDVLQQWERGQISGKDAALKLSLSTRQFRNIRRAYERSGVKGLTSKKLGRPSNRKLSKTVRANVKHIIGETYRGCGPTFVTEKLAENHSLKLSVNSVRALMIEDLLWVPSSGAPPNPHLPRPRRSHRGELVQIDASCHDWFEGRGPKCAAIVFIDDATSELLYLHFVGTETLEAYFDGVKHHLAQCGRPLAYYSDRHAIFLTSHGKASPGERDTQFHRAMRELGIELIFALTPQAKGRVERANRTLQDRLVAEMRLRGISTIEEANAFVPEYLAKHNARFAVPPASPSDLHRPVLPGHNVRKILAENTTRTVQKGMLFQYKTRFYQIKSSQHLYRAEITVWEDQVGVVHAEYRGHELSVVDWGAEPYEAVRIPEGESIHRSFCYNKTKLVKVNFKK